MNQIEKLIFLVSSVVKVIRDDEKFFSSISEDIGRLNHRLAVQNWIEQDELSFLIGRIDSFWKKWRPSGLSLGNSFVNQAESTVSEIVKISNELCALDQGDYSSLFNEDVAGPVDLPSQEPITIVENICTRFHAVARQLKSRYGNRETLKISDEYDVQDLLHSLLYLHFDDIRPEEWNPSYAGGASRTDFLLKNESIFIEVKKSRESLNARKLGEELIVDTVKYKEHPYCNQLFCFVYDPDEIINNPASIEGDLTNNKDGFNVIVKIFPQRY